MKIIVVFWLNAENLVGLIIRDPGRSIESQVAQWVSEASGYPAGECYGVEMKAAQQ